MGIEFVFKVAGVGLIVAVLNMIVGKSGRDEQALLVTIAGLIVVLALVIPEVGNLFESINIDITIPIIEVIIPIKDFPLYPRLILIIPNMIEIILRIKEAPNPPYNWIPKPADTIPSIIDILP